jgi:hypothetical protein
MTAREAVFSDIDGTLVESNWLHAAAWRDPFAVIDIPLDIETLRKQIGKAGDQLIPLFAPWWKRPVVEEPSKLTAASSSIRTTSSRSNPSPRPRPLPPLQMKLTESDRFQLPLSSISRRTAGVIDGSVSEL